MAETDITAAERYLAAKKAGEEARAAIEQRLDAIDQERKELRALLGRTRKARNEKKAKAPEQKKA